MKSKRRNMIIAGMLSVSMALGCSCFPVWAEEETEETTEDTVKNGGIENVLTADPIFTADPVQIEEEPEVVLGEERLQRRHHRLNMLILHREMDDITSK